MTPMSDSLDKLRLLVTADLLEQGIFPHSSYPECAASIRRLLAEVDRLRAERDAATERAAQIAEQYDPHVGSPGYERAITRSIAAAIREGRQP